MVYPNYFMFFGILKELYVFILIFELFSFVRFISSFMRCQLLLHFTRRGFVCFGCNL